MKFYKLLHSTLAAAALLFTILFLPLALTTAHADAPPPLISYQGHLLDSNGTPITGTTTITFALYSTALDSTPFWTETQSLTLDSGLFSVLLGSVTPLNPADFADGSAWLGIQPAGSLELVPRQQISSVPYALFAGSANYNAGYGLSLENNIFRVLSDTIQSRVTGTCPYGSAFKAVNADGSVLCNSVGITSVYRGTGILGEGSATTMGNASIYVDTNVIQRRVTGTCPTGSSIRTINADGSVVCDPPPSPQICRVQSSLTDGLTSDWITATLTYFTDSTLPCWDADTTPNYITVPYDGFYWVGAEGGITQHLPNSNNTNISSPLGTGVKLISDGGDLLGEASQRIFQRPGTGGTSVYEGEGRGTISSPMYLYAGTKIYMYLLSPPNEQASGSIWLHYLGQ